MSVAELPTKTITAEELFSLPEDSTHREIIRGELRKRPMTVRNKVHSGIESRMAYLLEVWRNQQPEPRGKVHSGEAGFRLRRDPETLVGIDVAYASAELIANDDPTRPFYDGPPVLTVEILSPADKHEDIVEKIKLYLEAGVVVWVVDPDFQIVRVHRPGQAPESFNILQELSGDPYLPGFRVRVARIFE